MEKQGVTEDDFIKYHIQEMEVWWEGGNCCISVSGTGKARIMYASVSESQKSWQLDLSGGLQTQSLFCSQLACVELMKVCLSPGLISCFVSSLDVFAQLITDKHHRTML